MISSDVFIVAAHRTAIGDFGGVFRDVSAVDLVSQLIQATVSNSGIPKTSLGKVILGNTLSPQNPNIARCAAISTGVTPETPAFSIHCACASAMQALISGTSALMLGEAETALVGGVESMSSTPYLLPAARWGQRLRHTQAVDLLWWGMQDDPVMGGMGVAADFLAEEYKISREEQDALAALSHRRAMEARDKGYFRSEIIPIQTGKRSKDSLIERDEHPRADATVQNLSKLRPAFTENGTVTAGNASGLNDGAAAIILATGRACREYGLVPLAQVGPWSIKALEPRRTGVAPVPAVREVVASMKMAVSDVDLIEMNEAFASYYLACEGELGLDRDRVNVNGSGISLGHPVGATGSRLVVTLLHEMIRRDASNGLASLCAGGGMGYALYLRRDFRL
jgi:acetyl-CoA C-acetyltransferase